MNLPAQRLDTFNNRHFNRGASRLKQVLWYACNVIFIRSAIPFSGLKKAVLRLFGAKIGKAVIIRPYVNIKFPWKLVIGDHTWIGERVWIDNLDQVSIGSHVCISQGAMLLCGNHNYKKASFDLFTRSIEIKDGAWVCARSMVGPGVCCGENSILGPMSFAREDLEANSIYGGNPAILERKRF